MALDRGSGPFSASVAIRVGDDNYNEPRNAVNQSVSQTYGFGTGNGQFNVLSSEQYTVPASTTTTLTLDNSSLSDMFGNTSNFGTIKAVRIGHAAGSDASAIDIGGTWTVGLTAGTDELAIKITPNGFFMLNDGNAGYTVGAGTTITLLNNDATNAATVTVDIFGI